MKFDFLLLATKWCEDVFNSISLPPINCYPDALTYNMWQRHAWDIYQQNLFGSKPGTLLDLDSCCFLFIQCTKSNHNYSNLNLDNGKTVEHCDCGRNMHKCLHDVNLGRGSVLGHYYFLHMKQCFSENYPIIKCEQYQSKNILDEDCSGLTTESVELKDRCSQYKLDTSKAKEYQLFDQPFYFSYNTPVLYNETVLKAILGAVLTNWDNGF